MGNTSSNVFTRSDTVKMGTGSSFFLIRVSLLEIAAKSSYPSLEFFLSFWSSGSASFILLKICFLPMSWFSSMTSWIMFCFSFFVLLQQRRIQVCADLCIRCSIGALVVFLKCPARILQRLWLFWTVNRATWTCLFTCCLNPSFWCSVVTFFPVKPAASAFLTSCSKVCPSKSISGSSAWCPYSS